MNEKVDVLMATYNGEKYLKEQIDSILNQTYQNIHLIISDDCSTDRTRDILKEYEENEKITVFYQENNQGYVKNFEFLLNQVTSELYMFADQDDFWLPEKIEKSVEKLQKENLDLVFGDLEVVDENLKTLYPSFSKLMLLDRKIKRELNTDKLQYLYNCMTGCTILSKKKFLDKILPLPTNSKYVIHDYWLGLVVSLNGKVGYLETPYIKYRQHGNNQVGTDKISHKFKKLEQVRNLFIDVKLGVFETYVQNPDVFPKNLQILNKKTFDYFKMLQTKKHFNFKGWSVFYNLYKTETLLYFVENFVILNMPFFAKIAFHIRLFILKLLGRR